MDNLDLHLQAAVQPLVPWLLDQHPPLGQLDSEGRAVPLQPPLSSVRGDNQIIDLSSSQFVLSSSNGKP